jgi:hypothetical protein
MRQFMMTVTALAVFGATVVAAQAAIPSPAQVSHRSPGYSDWATADEFQKLFDAMGARRRYPRVFEARVFNGIVLYHAVFEPYPADMVGFYSYMHMSPDLFAQRDDRLRRAGFRLVTKQSVHLGGSELIQATWVHTAQALNAAPSTCTGMKSVCLSIAAQTPSASMCNNSGGGHGGIGVPFCGGKFCDFEWEECMKRGLWQGSLVSRQVERR